MARVNDKHPGASLVCMATMRREGKLCDVVLQVEDREFKAHRVVLAGSSAYFRAMFAGELEESKQEVVTIRDIAAFAFETLLDYCYTSKVEVTEDNVQDLLAAAGILQLSWVEKACCDFMAEKIDPGNCLGIRAFAESHSCHDLQDAADLYAQQHYLEVLQSLEFLQLGCDDFITLLSSEDLNVQSEEQVYDSVMTWIKHDLDGRRDHLPTVLRHVRMPVMDRSYLITTVSRDPLIRQNEDCRDLVDTAKDYLLLPEQYPELEGPQTRPRRPMRSGEVLFAVGGWCSGDAISMVERFNPHSDEWKVVATMSKRRCGVGVAVVEDTLYAIGGHDGSSYLSSVERYDPKTNLWCSSVAPTSSSRTSVGVAVLEGYVYAVGGQDGTSCLNIVERYDPTNDRWAQVASMNTRRLGVAVAVLAGTLYAVGGSDGGSPLSTTERYDLKADRWVPMASMDTKRKHLGVAALDSMLYAVGGRDESTELSSVERYDPKADKWSPVVPMNSRRSGVGLSVVNGRLYAVGGFDGSSYLKSMEWLDTAVQQWNQAASMNYRRLGCGVGVMKLTGATAVDALG